MLSVLAAISNLTFCAGLHFSLFKRNVITHQDFPGLVHACYNTVCVPEDMPIDMDRPAKRRQAGTHINPRRVSLNLSLGSPGKLMFLLHIFKLHIFLLPQHPLEQAVGTLPR